MERKKTLISLIILVLMFGGIPLASSVWVPGTGETVKMNLYDTADPGASPVLYPDGQEYIELNDTYGAGQTFTVFANATDVTNCGSYAVGVTYDNTILQVTSYTEGEFFYRVDASYRTSPVNQPFLIDGAGELGYFNHVTWGLLMPGNVSGTATGTLAEFEFTVVGWGVTKIHIITAGAKACALKDAAKVPIDFNTIDIIFDNTGLVAMHELTVSLEAPDVVKPSESSLLNATVKNIGLSDETGVELQLLINGSVVNNATITQLLSGSNTTIDYLWTPTTEATYNVTAYVVPVLDENDTANNVVTKLVVVPYSYWCLTHTVVWDDVPYYIGTCSNATVSDLTFSQPDKRIIFNMQFPSYEAPGTAYCNVTIPRVLLDAPADRWNVTAGGVLTERTVSSNETHTVIYFTANVGPAHAKEVYVEGTIVIPEFSIVTLLALFLVATLVVVALKKVNSRREITLES